MTDPRLEADLNHWACRFVVHGRGTCDGHGGGVFRVMRADGPRGVALCRRCHRQYLAIWRAEDAARERDELVDDFRSAA